MMSEGVFDNVPKMCSIACELHFKLHLGKARARPQEKAIDHVLGLSPGEKRIGLKEEAAQIVETTHSRRQKN